MMSEDRTVSAGITDVDDKMIDPGSKSRKERRKVPWARANAALPAWSPRFGRLKSG